MAPLDKKNSRATLKDVAGEVGVHPSTVSRVLNPKTRSMVSESIANEVEKAAKRLGYTVNPFALGLRTQRSLTIGVLIPDLTNPVFPPMIRGIEHGLARGGYTAMLADSDNRASEERIIVNRFKARQVDGLVLATAQLSDDLINECADDDTPIVLVNRSVDNPAVPAIYNDDEGGIRLAVEHIADLGHKRIAHVAGPQNLSTGFRRYKAFVAEMNRLGLEVDEDLVVFSDSFSEQEGCRKLGALFETSKEFTAVIAGNDLLALGCYDAMAARGISCPEDLSVIGFNDMPFVDKFRPPLTTIRIPLFDMGLRAAELMLDLINTGTADPLRVSMKPQLIVRGSTIALDDYIG